MTLINYIPENDHEEINEIDIFANEILHLTNDRSADGLFICTLIAKGLMEKFDIKKKEEVENYKCTLYDIKNSIETTETLRLCHSLSEIINGTFESWIQYRNLSEMLLERYDINQLT